MTLTYWYRGINGNPGFTTEAFTAVKEKVTLLKKPEVFDGG